MLEMIIDWDKELFLDLNSFYTDFWDVIMFNITNKFFWIPLYLLFLYWLIRFYKKDSIWILLVLILVITESDQLSVHGFKNVFMRLRPCHDPDLSGLVHTVNGKCGGQFGFYSSHATNHFALAVYLIFIFKDRFLYFTPLILLWAGVISYSRIYLGVHFPADILAGALMGSLIGGLGYYLLRIIKPSMFSREKMNNK